MDEYNSYEALVRENIEYNNLVADNPYENVIVMICNVEP